LPAEIEDYQQVAVVAHVAAARAASGIAYERFTPDGPFAVLPLHNGHYGVVWTLTPQAAEHVMALPDAEYLAALQRAFGWRIGRLERVGQRSAYPLKLTRASVVTGPRVALIGNAAQALHPVAGQGFNLALRDIWELAQHAGAAADPGAPEVLAAYARGRQADRRGAIAFTDLLIDGFASDFAPMKHARGAGLLMLDLFPALRAFVAKRMVYGARAWP
jgi:2-octaprenyl-6-methoxyphenol hydroxylase